MKYRRWESNPQPIDFESIASANWATSAFFQSTHKEIKKQPLDIRMAQTTTTTEGVGNGAVDRVIPRIYNNLVRAENIAGLTQIIQENAPSPTNIDGGEIRAMMMGLSEEDMKTILKAAEILKSLGK